MIFIKQLSEILYSDTSYLNTSTKKKHYGSNNMNNNVCITPIGIKYIPFQLSKTKWEACKEKKRLLLCSWDQRYE